jgi:hypothetical protein
MTQLTLPPTNRKAKSGDVGYHCSPPCHPDRSAAQWRDLRWLFRLSPPCHPERTRGASWESNGPASCTNNKRWVPHCPDFLWRLVALIHSMRLSLMKGAHADFSCAAWQEIGSSPVFACPGAPWGLEWDTQHSTTPQSPPGYPARQGVPWEQSTWSWHLEKEMTQQNSPRMRGPEGRLAKHQPSPEGLGINPEDDMSAVGAALNPASTCAIPRPQP